MNIPNQDDLIDFVKNPKNISKAARASMDKRLENIKSSNKNQRMDNFFSSLGYCRHAPSYRGKNRYFIVGGNGMTKQEATSIYEAFATKEREAEERGKLYILDKIESGKDSLFALDYDYGQPGSGDTLKILAQSAWFWVDGQKKIAHLNAKEKDA